MLNVEAEVVQNNMQLTGLWTQTEALQSVLQQTLDTVGASNKVPGRPRGRADSADSKAMPTIK
eukprot:2445996-Heterocapsa_arctica.AAC.1